MKKKILLIASMIAVVACLFAISVSAENKIIKLDTCPTLEEIHADRDAYVSHLDAFDGNSYGEIDSESVVVLSDLAETPTYYVYPSYYYIQSTKNHVYNQLKILNTAISAADPTAFAGYATIDNNYCGGSCKYLIRFEVPTYVTAIEARAKFENSSNLLEVYFPTKTVIDEETGLEKTVTYVTSVSGQNLFSICEKLEYIHNMGYLPTGIIQGNNAGFSSCKALKEIVIPEGVTSIPNYMFSNCQSVKEIVLPNSVTYMGKQAFASCYSLEKFSFGANFTSFGSPNNDYETFSGTNNLKFVYMPVTVANSLINYTGASLNNQFKNIFSNSSKAVIFLTGSEEDALLIKGKFAETNANGNIANADMAAYDQTVDYVALQFELKKSIIVYGYSTCEAFYGGHKMSDDITMNFDGYMKEITFGSNCTNADCKYAGNDDSKTIGAIFVSLGYSYTEAPIGGTYSVAQFFGVNEENLAKYEAYTGNTLSFGIVAAGNKGAGVIKPFECDKFISHDFTNDARNYFEIKITGIDESNLNTKLVFCAYVIENGEISYLNNKQTVEDLTGESYEDVVAIKNAE